MRRACTATAALSVVTCLCFARAAGAQAPAPYAPPPPAPVAPIAPAAPSAAAPPAAAAPDAAPPSLSDDVLRRLLRSGCRDGLPEARLLAERGAAPWAETVTRLCGEILHGRAAAAVQSTDIPVLPQEHPERDGRGTLVIASTLYGIWAGIATDVLFTIDGVRSAIVSPLVGMGAGLALSLGLTADHPITNGQAWSIVTGLEYGSLNGAFWGLAFQFDEKKVIATTLATGLAAGAGGLFVAKGMKPTQGDVEVVRSGLLWGTLGGLLGMATFAPDSQQKTVFRAAAVSMDLGLLAGVALAASFDVSRNRDLIIDAGTLGGAVAGFGITVLVAGVQGDGRGVAAGTLGGMVGGMLLSIFLTRDMDEPDDDDASPVAALLGRDARGRWHLGSPSPTPVFDGLGRRVVGATFNALAGTF